MTQRTHTPSVVERLRSFESKRMSFEKILFCEGKKKMSESSFIRTTSTSWSNSTFIFPCISIGNIGQLSADLLISTIPNMVKAGYFIDNNLVQPIIGYDPYNQTSRELCVSVECM